MGRVTRRAFLEESLLASAAIAAPAFGAEPRRSRSPNERLRVAVLGVRGQGRVHVTKWASMPDAEVAVVCDPDAGVVGEAQRVAEQKSGKKPAYVADLRKVFEDKSIDVVSIATPNHWHCLAAIWAVQAGKDVYVEKPLGHNVREQAMLVAAARKHNRLVQMGNYPRSLGHVRAGIDFLRSGKMGKIHLARGICYNRRESIGRKPDGAPPEGVDYGLWLGPAPERAFNPNRFHYNWHWNWDFGGGEIANNGIYQLDTARWGLGKDTLPSKVVSIGGRLGYEDDGTTPNTQVSVFEWEDARIVQEIRGLPSEKFKDVVMGTVFHCEKGYVAFNISGTAAFTETGEPLQKFAGAGEHFRNFADAVRARKREMLNSDVQDGHLSSSLCHLANVSYRLGTMKPRAAFVGYAADALGEATERMFKHLADNGLKDAQIELRIGKPLAVDASTLRLPGDPAADALLGREYRKPFVMPDTV